jgi:hypothetical protein
VYVHHFTMVREDDADVLTKAKTSTIGDGRDEPTDFRAWRERVWPAIPNVTNFHYNRGSEHVWRSISTITLDDLPVAARATARKVISSCS